MKKTILILIMTLLMGSVFAEAISLEKICSSLAARPNTTGDFTQTKTVQTNGRSLKSSGKYILSPEGILWKTEKPFPSSLILTKDAMVQVAANGTKSVMSGKDNQIFANVSDTLSSVFSGDIAKLQKNFNCDFKKGEGDKWSVTLSPKDATISSVMKTLVLSGSYNEKADTAELLSLEMTEASGNTILYDFTNQKYPKELSKDEKQNFVIE